MTHFGIDLDNTIIDYSEAFAMAAGKLGLLPADHGLTSKGAVKDRLQEIGGDTLWMKLQGQVYGRFIGLARPYDGALETIRWLRGRGAKVSIVSHKTRLGHFDDSGTDLWQAALGWLDQQGFLDETLAVGRENVHFHETLEGKVAAINALGVKAFVDDLPKVMAHPDLSQGVKRILFAPDELTEDESRWAVARNWNEVLDILKRLN
jgi:hypothetical protein